MYDEQHAHAEHDPGQGQQALQPSQRDDHRREQQRERDERGGALHVRERVAHLGRHVRAGVVEDDGVALLQALELGGAAVDHRLDRRGVARVVAAVDPGGHGQAPVGRLLGARSCLASPSPWPAPGRRTRGSRGRASGCPAARTPPPRRAPRPAGPRWSRRGCGGRRPRPRAGDDRDCGRDCGRVGLARRSVSPGGRRRRTVARGGAAGAVAATFVAEQPDGPPSGCPSRPAPFDNRVTAAPSRPAENRR